MTNKRWVKPSQPLLNPTGLFNKATQPNTAIDWTNHDPDLAEICQKCSAVVDHYDATGGAWCDGCVARAQLVNAGFYQDFPRLAQNGKVIPAGKQGWQGFAMGAPVQVVTLLAGAIGVRKEVAA